MGLMDLDKAREGYYFASGKTSDVARQLGFAGIALVWLFREPLDGGGYRVPSELLLPAVLIVASLAADFLHYFTAALLWGWYSRRKEKDLAGSPNARFDAPPQINWVGNGFWGLKAVAIILAYAFLLSFLFRQFGAP